MKYAPPLLSAVLWISPLLAGQGKSPLGLAARGLSPAPARNLERYRSQDGKIELWKPRDWTVQVGAIFGAGSYGVALDSPGETAGFMFQVTTLVPPLGTFWQVIAQGFWAPADDFARSLPLLAKVLASQKVDAARVAQQGSQVRASMRNNFAKVRNAMRGLQKAYDDYHASWRKNQVRNDYVNYLVSETIRGQSTWVARREGGEVVETDDYGATDERARRAEGRPFSTTYFKGRSPFTGDQLHEVNTFELWKTYVQGR